MTQEQTPTNLTRKQRRAIKKSGRSRKRVALKVTIVTVIVLVILLGSVIGYAEYRYHQTQRINIKRLDQELTGQPIDFLLVGNNSRCVLDGKQSASFGTCSEVGGARSDVTTLLRLDPATKSAFILSIPRDLFVHIPDFKNSAPGRQAFAKIDAALNLGPQVLVDTIEQDLGIPVNHYVSLNFDTFQNVVNDLGGINMYFPTQMYDLNSGLRITQPGCIHLNGTQALEVVRSRMLHYMLPNGAWAYDGNGDISRIVRVHEFLKVLAEQIKPQITNPFTLNSLLSSVAPQLQIDSALSLSELASLGWAFHGINPNSIPTLTLPTTPISSYRLNGANYGDVVFPVQPADQQVIAQFLGKSPVTLGTANPSSINITVIGGTGNSAATQKVEASLSQLGYNIVATLSSPTPQTPLETTIYYPDPSELNQAETLLNSLSGEAILAQSNVYSKDGLTLVVGSTISVSAPNSPSTSQATSATTTTTSTAPPSTSSTSTTSPTPTYSTGPVSPAAVYPASQPLPWYDPRACPSSK